LNRPREGNTITGSVRRPSSGLSDKAIASFAAAAFRLLLVAACAVPAAGHASAIAVKRGQARVDPAILPLVCVEIGTVGKALPLDSVTFENLDSHAETRMVLSNSFDASHPDMLTAAAPGPRSLSLPILKLKPGRYQMKSLEFVGPGYSTLYGRSISSYTMNLAGGTVYWFEVRAGCVNYVGGLEIAANWAAIYYAAGQGGMANQPAHTEFPTTIAIVETARRDAKWACDVDPGMLSLPASFSAVHRD
jgi:hypothetical protein